MIKQNYVTTFFFAFAMLCVLNLKAQTPACTPNAIYKDSAAGVYPLPHNSTSNPKGGITTAACIGKPYNFVFTIKADSITYSGFKIPLDSITLATTDAVAGLPAGLTYACNPPRCAFLPKILGCAVIIGTVKDTATVKGYSLLITGKAYIAVFGGVTQTFPSSTFPGDYTINVLAKTNPLCFNAGTNDLNTAVASLTTAPNPVYDNLFVSADIISSGVYESIVTDIAGKVIFSEKVSLNVGENNWRINTNNFSSGLYFLNMAQNGKVLNSQKFVVQK